MNKNTKTRHAQERKSGKYFHGDNCLTAFADREKNLANKRKRPYHAPNSKG